MRSSIRSGPWRTVVKVAFLMVLLAVPRATLAQSQYQRQTLNVLVLGNSQLWSNNFADVLAGIASADPMGPIIVATLGSNSEEAAARHFGNGQKWDYVIYQALALLPGLREYVEPAHVNIWPEAERQFKIGSVQEFQASARNLNAEAKKHGAKFILFPSPPRRLARFDTDQLPVWKEILDAHHAIGRELGAEVAPIQEAFEESRQRLIGLDLLMWDASHPSPAGTYLEGLVIYSMITNRDPIGAPTLIYGRPISYLPGSNQVNNDLRVPLVEMHPATAMELQRIAWHATQNRVRTASR